MQVYDPELILSWTPRDFKNFIQGAKLREVDEWQKLARGAMFHRYAMNEKRAKENKMFDHEAARRRILKGSDEWQDSKALPFDENKQRAAQTALQKYMNAFYDKKAPTNEKR